MDNKSLDNLTSAIVALIEAMGMHAENQWRIQNGECLAYGEDAFNCIIAKHRLTGY
jgi:hypothetical protein